VFVKFVILFLCVFAALQDVAPVRLSLFVYAQRGFKKKSVSSLSAILFACVDKRKMCSLSNSQNFLQQYSKPFLYSQAARCLQIFAS
jgi:hypothetical protein